MKSSDYSNDSQNMGLSYVMAIAKSLYYCVDFARAKNYYDWFFELLSVFRQIRHRIKKKEDIENVEKVLWPKIESMLASNANQKGLFCELHNLESELRRMVREAGLEMHESDDPRFAMYH